MSVLPPDRVWRRRKESGLTEERERLRETHKYRLYTAACNWAQKQKPKESSVLTTNTGKLPSEETFYVNALQGHSTPKNYWTIITAMGFDRKTIRFGALHNEIKSNLRRDLRFSAYVISGGFINSCRERYRHHGLEKAKGFPCQAGTKLLRRNTAAPKYPFQGNGWWYTGLPRIPPEITAGWTNTNSAFRDSLPDQQGLLHGHNYNFPGSSISKHTPRNT